MFLNLLFILSALFTVLGALGVVFQRNLMHSCVSLLLSLFGVAGLYASLGADFLAAAQLVIYAGGVVILMLFAIMITGGVGETLNKFGLEKVSSMGNLKTYLFGGGAVLLLGMILVKIFVGIRGLGLVEVNDTFESTVESLGTLLITDHVLAFEISSVLLLGALVGAAVISRPRREMKS